MIIEELAQLLRLTKEGGRLNLNGIGETNSLSKSRVNLTVITISNLQPDRRVNKASLSIPSNVADFYKLQKIDLLIGAGLFFDLMCVGQIKLGPSLPVLQKTSLGWIVTGKYNQSKDSFNSKVFHLNTSIEDESNVDSIVRES